ncbi:MAG: hypothetical protein HY706_02980 [Candidatus Hydrogenedentes bacterium]|nr:hypothetical protein [Candidatus Hydrogenedentota bacterium]
MRMFRYITSLILYLSAVVFQHLATASETLPLSQNWRLQSSAQVKAGGEQLSTPGYAAEGWYPTSVPTTVLAALVENKVSPDPYYGDNLKSIPGYREGRWLVMPEGSPFKVSWWFRTEFELPASHQGKDVALHLDGINYRANVWLNGRQVANSNDVIGMFRRFEFNITEFARTGAKNALAVECIPPGQFEDKQYRTKQLEATTGWDDHNPYPPDMNLGLWQNAYVTATGPARLRNPYVLSDLDVPSLKKAGLTVTVDVVNTTDAKQTAEISGKIEEITFSQTVELGPNETRSVRFAPDEFKQLTISKPRVWWPNPLGPQELYQLELTAHVQGQVSDTNNVRFGIREATTYINDEGWRGYKINGRNVLIRGGAWMTSDMLLRLTHKRYDALIRYARNANLNMLRSEGFSIRETEDFYNLCDEYGVMVTQQIFGRNIPDEPLAIKCIEDMMLRVRTHPSLVHFLGHDETFPTPTLDQAYKDLLAKYDVNRTYQPHSGAFDVEERVKTGGTRTGTLELWTYATPGHYYTHKEDGAWGFAQSGGIGGIIAPVESMRKMMPEQALWPPWTDIWSFHTVIQGGKYFDAVVNALNARYGQATGIEDFCKKGQLLNYESARGMFEAYARNKYSAMGITTWKYDAAWPASPTWQYVDWYLQAGGAYYGAQKACEALHVQYSYDDHSIYVVNSLYQEFKNLKVWARVFNLDMTEKWSKESTANVDPDGKTSVFAVEWPADLTKTHFLRLDLADLGGKPITSNLYWFSTVPDIPADPDQTTGRHFLQPKSVADFTDLSKLLPVKLELASKIQDQGREKLVSATVKNPTPHLAFAVHLAVRKGADGPEVTPTFWKENYFSLLPGEEKSVAAAFYPEDLGDVTPTVSVDGWNVLK